MTTIHTHSSTLTGSGPEAISVPGYMAMPADFPYREVFRKGRPRHRKTSSFRLRHPSMPCAKRAKIFAPFDALAGFDQRIANKEILYEDRRELDEGKKADLDRKISLLCRLAGSRKAMRQPFPQAVITYYCPCTDPENEAWGHQGSYRAVRGPVSQVDPVLSKTLTIDGTRLAMDDIVDIDDLA